MEARGPQGDARDALALASNVARGLGPPPAELSAQAAAHADQGARLPPAEVRGWLEALLLGPHVERGLEWINEVGILAVVLPEIAATVDFTQEGGRHHKDVWKHTKQVVAGSAPDPAVRWAALLHDMAKVPTRRFTPEGKVTFHGHAEVGARMFDKIALRLAFPESLGRCVRALILHHLRAGQYEAAWTDSAVRRFDRQLGPNLDRLFLLSRADITSAREEKRSSAWRRLDELRMRLEGLREIDARLPPLPSGLGKDLMAHYELSSGSWFIGELLRALTGAVNAGELDPRKPAEIDLDYLDQHPELVERAKQATREPGRRVRPE